MQDDAPCRLWILVDEFADLLPGPEGILIGKPGCHDPLKLGRECSRDCRGVAAIVVVSSRNCAFRPAPNVRGDRARLEDGSAGGISATGSAERERIRRRPVPLRLLPPNRGAASPHE